MALIECFECKQSISSMAPACIHCGAPTGVMLMATSMQLQQSPLYFGQSTAEQSVPRAASGPTVNDEAPLSFGRLPTDESVPRALPEVTVKEQAALSFEPLPTKESAPRATPAAFRRRNTVEAPVAAPAGPRPVALWLKIMVFLLPPFFVWFLLRPGHSNMQRLIGFGWLGLMIALSRT